MTFNIFLIAPLFTHQGKIGMKRARPTPPACHPSPWRGIDDQAIERRQ
jgi:hypothetical protein